MFQRSILFSALLVGGFSFLAIAAGPKITDPSKVDKDYALQGEYAGNFEDEDGNLVKGGAQVIALGEGKFGLAFLEFGGELRVGV